MQNSVKQRLIRYLAFKGIPHLKFEKTCGMSSGYVKSIRRSIGEDKLRSIALNYPDLSRNWLLFGEGDMLNEGYTSFNPVAMASPLSLDEGDNSSDNELIDALKNQIKTLSEIIAEKDKQIDKLQKQIDILIGKLSAS